MLKPQIQLKINSKSLTMKNNFIERKKPEIDNKIDEFFNEEVDTSDNNELGKSANSLNKDKRVS